jgi:transcriptional regulator with XRE-family HTH domain
VPATKGPIDELRAEAASRILKHTKGLSTSEAANQLGVSRQAIYDLRRGKYRPSLAFIERACEAWPELEFTFRGLSVGKKTLHATKRPAAARPTQAHLFDALGLLKNKRLEVVQARRTGTALELVLRIQIPA